MESGTYKHGTTLVEILMVVAVIAILAGLVGGIGTAIDSYSKTEALEGTFALLDAALDEYKDFKGYYPTAVDPDPNVNSETLYGELSSTPGSREVIERMSEKVVKDEFNPGVVPEIYDPWGTVLNYVYDPTAGYRHPKLISAGPDKRWVPAADNVINQ